MYDKLKAAEVMESIYSSGIDGSTNYTSRYLSEEFASRANSRFAHYTPLDKKGYAAKVFDKMPVMDRQGSIMMNEPADKKTKDMYRTPLIQQLMGPANQIYGN